MASIYEYTNYRDYLREFYERKKKSSSSFSYKFFSKLADIKAPNFLKLVIDGKKNLTIENIYKFAKALKLNKSEYEYFENCVKFNQSKNEEERYMYLQRMLKLRKNKLAVKFLDDRQYKSLSKWYYFVLREMVLLTDFNDDPKWISKRLRGQMTTYEVEEAIQLLEEIHIIEKDGDRYRQVDDFVTSSDEVTSLLLRMFHREMIKKASEALSIIPIQEREYQAFTFVLKESMIPMMKQKIKEFIMSLAKEVSPLNEGEDVYQLNVQFFRHTSPVQERIKR
jgi:uncharacterized protein (TIGR02147 family)